MGLVSPHAEPQVAYPSITPKSIFGYCVASSFTYGLKANPVPMMTS